MKPKSALKALKDLLEAPSFTSKEAKVYGVTAATLAHYVKSGELERLSRGTYKHKNAPAINDLRWEELVNATQTVKGGIVCLISALTLYGVTDEMPREYWIAIGHGTSHKSGPHVRLVRMRDIKLGKTTFTIEGIKIPIFDLERTLVDTFRLLDKETAIKALKAALNRKKSEKINIKKLEDYAKKLKVNIKPYLLSVTT